MEAMKRGHPSHEFFSGMWRRCELAGGVNGSQRAVMKATIDRLYVSPGHNFFGHHGKPAGQNPAREVAALRCRAGRGIEGDRFLDYKPDYAGQITFFEAEVFEALCATLGLSEATPAGLRRNVVTRGLELESLTGREFCLQGVWFRGAGECKPCYWMDAALGPGAEAWLRGRGGLRARILSEGILRIGPAELAERVAGASRANSVSVGIERIGVGHGGH